VNGRDQLNRDQENPESQFPERRPRLAGRAHQLENEPADTADTDRAQRADGTDSDDEAAPAEVATGQELDSLNHFEVSIPAGECDLGTGDPGGTSGQQLHSRPRLGLQRARSPPTDRARWSCGSYGRGACRYAEALTLDGATVDDPITDRYPEPDGPDTLTFEEISAMQSGETPWPEPCPTLDVINVGGQAALGTRAGQGSIEAFRPAWLEVGL
jgi:hypothetical protein